MVINEKYSSAQELEEAMAWKGPLVLDRYHTKNELAFLWSFQAIVQSSPRSYFWTLTPDGYMSDRLFAKSVKRFLDRWARWGQPKGFKALRIYEPFQSGFLHCHFVTNVRLSIQALRRIAYQTGIGRIHVHPKPVTPALAHYMLKYMGKNRSALGGGLRTWAKWGKWQHSLVRNVEVISDDSNLMRECYAKSLQEVYQNRDLHDEYRINMGIRRIPHRRAWVQSRVLFYKHKMEQIRAWTPDEMVPF